MLVGGIVQQKAGREQNGAKHQRVPAGVRTGDELVHQGARQPCFEPGKHPLVHDHEGQVDGHADTYEEVVTG